MMPENQVTPKRPYVLLPPTEIPSDGEPRPAAERALAGDETLSFQISFREAQVTEPSVSAAVRQKAAPLPLGLGLLLFVVLPSALGSVAGFHLAGQWASDATLGSIVGGAAGLVLGGVCLLWNRRKG
jgi:hypothetical protein